jgi:hypothetical protein
MLSRVVLSDIHDLERGPRGQAFASYGRLVTCAQASAGQRAGTSGTNLGKAPPPWAFADAAVLGVRDTPAGQNVLASVEKNHPQGPALTIVAHPWARAV